MMETYVDYFSSPVGLLRLEATASSLLRLDFVKSTNDKPSSNPILLQTQEQLEDYFKGRSRIFTISLYFQGTTFQNLVWTALQKIPYGETWSYKDLALQIQKDKAYRAVGNANNKNPISIIIPCHRVIGANNQLIGYGGGLDKKEWLLQHEQHIL